MALPSGDSVTFLFSDIEGSTRLALELGPERWAATLRAHDRLVDSVVGDAGGTVVKHDGDGAFAVFADTSSAAHAAVALSRAIAGSYGGDAPSIRVRIGLHTGIGSLTDDGADYVGIDVHYAARVAAAANGGQIATSDTTAASITEAVGAGPGSGVDLVDDGFHPLRDFEEPRHLFRIVVPGVADDPRPLRSLRLKTNLPEPVTTFVGREREIGEVAALLGGARILTLTGPGGTGKTRLAIGLAKSIGRRFPDGTWFVDLAPVRDPALIPSAVASAIGIHETPEIPIIEAVSAHVRDRELLLVIDNLEQLLPAAADLVADLVRGADRLRVVVTSREVLRVAGEQEYAVPPLDDVEAVELFAQRARLVRPGFALTAQVRPVVGDIVTRLEGLPLAVELAAARIRIFSPAQILERLGRSFDVLSGGARDVPERQRTLRAAVAWSVDLLDADDQALFRRLAVFSGGWTADAAQTVADPDGSIDAVGGLESLADKSLLRIVPSDHGATRFNRHAFVREYAAELLEAAGERPTCERRHATVFVAVAEAAEPHLMAEDSDTWHDLLGHEQHNLRAAMRWSLTVGEPGLGLRIAAAIWRYWHQQAELQEGRAWLSELLGHPAGQADSTDRTRALSAAGGLAYWAQDFEAAWRAYEEALAIAERLGDGALIANAEYEIGFRFVVERDADRIRLHEARALELYEAIGDEDGAVRARQALVLAAFLDGDRDAARRLEEENLVAFRRSGSWYRTADSLTLLGAIDFQVGDLQAADLHLREALSIVGPRNLAAPIVGALGLAAHVALAKGDDGKGARLAGAAEALAARVEIANALIEVLHLPDPVVSVRERLGPDGDALLDIGRLMPIDEAVALALS